MYSVFVYSLVYKPLTYIHPRFKYNSRALPQNSTEIMKIIYKLKFKKNMVP